MIQFLSNKGFRKYFANTSWLLGERVFRMTISLFVGIYVARYLGPERFGLLSYALSFVWLFSSLASLGLNDILVRELVNQPENSQNLIATALWLKVCGFGLMGLTVTVVLIFKSEDQLTLLLISIIILGFLFQATNVVEFYFQAKVQSKFIVRTQVVQLLITSIFKIYLVWSKASLLWFALALMLDQALIAILFLYLYKWKVKKFPFLYFNWEKTKLLIRDGWPLIFTGMVVLVYMKIDQVMLKEMLNTKAVGVYAAAVRLCETLYFIPTALMASLFPAVVYARKKSEKMYEQRIQKLYDLMVWGSVIIAIPTTLVSNWIILLLYGSDFQEAADVLRIYIWALVFVSLGVASSKWLVAENLQHYSFYITTLGAIVNVGCNLWLIPIHGIKGAAIATLLAQGTVSFLGLSFFGKTRKNCWKVINSLNAYGAYKRIFH
ncbi:MAG: O-unit flippase [Deltaproteobacteria bacterium]|nr:O-unit flippase [Deltaproteobacteria bacterium]